MAKFASKNARLYGEIKRPIEGSKFVEKFVSFLLRFLPCIVSNSPVALSDCARKLPVIRGLVTPPPNMRERPPGADTAVDRATETPRDSCGSDTSEKLSQFAEEDEARDSREHSERDVAHREADDTNIVLRLRGEEEYQSEFICLRGVEREGRRVIGDLDEGEILNNNVRSRTATARMRQAETRKWCQAEFIGVRSVGSRNVSTMSPDERRHVVGERDATAEISHRPTDEEG